MDTMEKILTRALHVLIALCLTCMTVFVFTNVVLRYFFDSGIDWTEEVSRYLFVWLIFLGAIVGLRENAHLGVEILVNRLPLKGKKPLFIFNNLVILILMAMIVHGSFKVTVLTWTQASAATNMPLSVMYLSGLVSSAAMVLICLSNLYKLCTGKDDKDVLEKGPGGEETW